MFGRIIGLLFDNQKYIKKKTIILFLNGTLLYVEIEIL